MTVIGEASAGSLVVNGNASFVGNVTFEGSLYSEGEAPEVTVGMAAGQEGEVTIDGTDTAGTIIIRAKAGVTDAGLPEQLAPGEGISIVFNNQFAAMPRVQLTAVNEGAVNVEYYVSRDENGFKLIITEPLTPGKEYSFDYFVIGAETKAAATPN